MTRPPLLGRRPTIGAGIACLACIGFAATTGGLFISPVRTAAAFVGILMGTATLASLAPVFDNHPPPPPQPVAVAQETPVAPAAGSMHALLESLYPDEPEPAVPAPLRLVDADTGELVGDRVLRLEERADGFDRRLGELGDVVAEQNELLTRALGTLRREVERIGHVFPEPADAN